MATAMDSLSGDWPSFSMSPGSPVTQPRAESLSPSAPPRFSPSPSSPSSPSPTLGRHSSTGSSTSGGGGGGGGGGGSPFDSQSGVPLQFNPRLLVELLATHATLGGVCTYCARSLGELCRVEDMRPELLAINALSALLVASERHLEREDFAWFACKTIAAFCEFEGGLEAVLEQGGEVLLANALRLHAATSPYVALYAAKATALLAVGVVPSSASPGAGSTASPPSAPAPSSPTTTSSPKFPSSPSSPTSASSPTPFSSSSSSSSPSFSSSSYTMPTGKAAVFRVGIPTLLRPSLSGGDARAVYYVLKAGAILGAPSTPLTCRRALCDAGWAEGVVGALTTHAASPSASPAHSLAVVGAGFRAIAAMGDYGGMRGGFFRAGAPGLVMRLLGAYGASPDVAAGGCRALGVLVGGSRAHAKECCTLGVVPLLLLLLDAHRGDGEVVGAVCKALAECAVMAQVEARAGGALETVVAAMEAHPMDAVVQREGRRAKAAFGTPAPLISAFSDRPREFGARR